MGLICNFNGKFIPKESIMKSVTSFRTLIAITALLFAIVTCHGKEQPSDQVVGTWTKSLNERTVTFTINADLTYTVEFAGDESVDVQGSYEISGTQITFNDEAGEYSADEPGVYEFKASDTSLIFTKVNDPVYGRSMLVEGSWSKAK
jgi:hypothetical protein